MHAILPFVIGIIILVVLIEMLAKKIKIAYPILLVVAGLLISTIPSLPVLKINPDYIFFIFLPPLLFEASWSISFKGLKRWWRIIGSFSFIVVFFTATSVAVFTNYFIPGFSLALGFLLGAIVSPPDAVSAGAILKFVKIPKSTSTILEGESLFNDAASLIVFRFALVAVATGQFIWGDTIISFSWMVLGGAALGIILGWIFTQAHKRLPTDAPSNIVFTLLEPYILYWVAEQLHSSGVMAVVCGGLFLSTQRFKILNSESRISGFNFWESFVFILNGLVFFIIGLDLTEIVSGLKSAGIPLSTGIYYGVMVTVVIVFIRILASYIALFSTYIFRRKVLTSNFSFKNSWRTPLILGWTGMRGVVSLAAALSIPVYLDSESNFPQRALILFISFVVIILTLFVQGLTLPYIIKRFGLDSMLSVSKDDDASLALRKATWQFSINYVREKHSRQLSENIFLSSKLSYWEDKLKATDEDLLDPACKNAYLEILEAQRQFLIVQNKNADLNETLVHREIHLIDLEEEQLKAMHTK